MRIIFPILNLSYGGAQRMLAEITNGLCERGHEVIIVTPADIEVKYPIQSVHIRGKNPNTINVEDIPSGDFIVSNYYSMVEACCQASIRNKSIHVRFSLCYEPNFLPNNHLSFPTYHMTPHIIVLSEWQKKIVEINHGITGHIVPIGVSNFMHNMHFRETTPPPIKISAIMRNMDGDISWHRDQPYLIDQLSNVKLNYPSAEINLICPPNEYSISYSLQRLQESGFFQICLPHNDDELRYLYNKSDIYVSSSIYDSGSMPGLEAMRCGAALVTVYSGGNVEYARNEVNCLLSHRYEYRLAHDIMRLIRDPDLRTALARTGEANSYNWTWQRSVLAFEQVLLNL
jgi:glycosyltransferase involved in cell wall biosynthesis